MEQAQQQHQQPAAPPQLQPGELAALLHQNQALHNTVQQLQQQLAAMQLAQQAQQQQQQQQAAPPPAPQQPQPALFQHGELLLNDMAPLLATLQQRKAIELNNPQPQNAMRVGSLACFTGEVDSVPFRDFVVQLYLQPGELTEAAVSSYLRGKALTAWCTSIGQHPEWPVQQRLLHLAGTFGAGSQRAKALQELHGFRQGRLGVADFNVRWLNLAVEAGVYNDGGIVNRYAAALNQECVHVFMLEKLEREGPSAWRLASQGMSR